MTGCIRVCGAHCDSPNTCPFYTETSEECHATSGAREILPSPCRIEHTLGEAMQEIEKEKRRHFYAFYDSHTK